MKTVENLGIINLRQRKKFVLLISQEVQVKSSILFVTTTKVVYVSDNVSLHTLFYGQFWNNTEKNINEFFFLKSLVKFLIISDYSNHKQKETVFYPRLSWQMYKMLFLWYKMCMSYRCSITVFCLRVPDTGFYNTVFLNVAIFKSVLIHIRTFSFVIILFF